MDVKKSLILFADASPVTISLSRTMDDIAFLFGYAANCFMQFHHFWRLGLDLSTFKLIHFLIEIVGPLHLFVFLFDKLCK